jgi:hypothetical protein
MLIVTRSIVFSLCMYDLTSCLTKGTISGSSGKFWIKPSIQGSRNMSDCMSKSQDNSAPTRKIVERKVGGIWILDLNDYRIVGKWQYIRV